jgi:hypothetical protein
MSSDQKQKGDVTMGFWLLYLAAIVGGPALLAGQASGRWLSKWRKVFPSRAGRD